VIWGLGGARTLALALRWPFFYRIPGALVGGLLGAALSVLLARWCASRRDRRRTNWEVAMLMSPLYVPLYDLVFGGHQPWRGEVLLAGSLAVVLLSFVSLSRSGWFMLAIVIPLVVYLPDISPYVGRADTFEFQVVGPTLGIAHPSGYPLYVLLAKLFSLMPLGSTAWRVNLSSAVFGALASGLLFLALTERPQDGGGAVERVGAAGVRPDLYPLAWAVALALAFSPTLWSRAIEAEVYALNAALVAMGLYLAVRWHVGDGKVRRIWPAFGLLIGVALASHITLGALIFLAASGLWVARLRPRLDTHGRAWLWAAGLGLAGLALYAYIPLRWPAVNGGERMTLAHFVRFVTNAESGGALRPLAFYRDPARWGVVGRLIRRQIGWAGIGMALLGWVLLARRHAALALGTFASCAAWVWFNLSFYVADPDYSAFLIPAHVVILFWTGWGVLSLGRHYLDRRGDRLPLFFAIVLLLPMSRLWQTGPALDTITQGRADETWARYALRQPLARGAAILADSEKFPPLYYLQQVEGIRPDLEMVTLFNEAQYRQALEARLTAGQTVYLARYLPGVDLYGVRSEGPLVLVAPESMAGSPPATPVDFGNRLALAGVSSAPDPFDRPLQHVSLRWYVAERITDDLDVRFRLVDPVGGRVLWETNRGRPVSGYSSTQAWQVGWYVQDYHALAWPVWLAAGRYELEVGLFPRFQDEGLPVLGGETVWHPVGSVAVPAQSPAVKPPPSQGGAVLFDRTLWLSGYHLPEEVAAGATLDLDIIWFCRAAAADVTAPVIVWDGMANGVGGAVVQGHLMGAGSGATCDGAVVSPVAGSAVGTPAPVMRRYAVRVPDRLGRYRVALRLSSPGGNLYPAQCRWLGRTSTRCLLGTVTVGHSQAGLANFDSRILLASADFDAAGVPAGGPLVVDLAWRALREIERDYTVFLQVVGPDGQLYGQVDSWPVQGTRPTSGWEPGETLMDGYRFYVDTDGPPGTYTLIAGWYLLADMSRLPVVETDGRVVGDYVTIGTFNLP
jgi:hypothetical protein